MNTLTTQLDVVGRYEHSYNSTRRRGSLRTLAKMQLDVIGRYEHSYNSTRRTLSTPSTTQNFRPVPILVTLSEPSGHHYTLFQTIRQLLEPTAPNSLKPLLAVTEM